MLAGLAFALASPKPLASRSGMASRGQQGLQGRRFAGLCFDQREHKIGGLLDVALRQCCFVPQKEVASPIAQLGPQSIPKCY
jgi:hypothetical protein